MKPFQEKDLKYHWHPCMVPKDLEDIPPFWVHSAKGAYLHGEGGHRVIDGISSWWCKALGHGHPRLREALLKQVERFEHVISATTTHEALVHLSEKLVHLVPGMGKVFYAGDGSSAVEIALKMSLHSHLNQGYPLKKKFASFQNGFHGETVGALSVSHVDTFKNVYQPMLFESLIIQDLPYVCTPQDPLWEDCEVHWVQARNFLEKHHHELTAIIFEPILQAAAGMKIYSPDFLRRLRHWSKEHNISLIADEIMTGLGRTGKMFACEIAPISPDFMCLSKGLTAGWMPFSAVLVTDEIHQCFYNTSKGDQPFLHSHTYSGHALGTAVALETIQIIQDLLKEKNLSSKADYLFKSFQEVADQTGLFSEVRGIGMVVAGDLHQEFFSREKMKKIIHKAFQKGALLRPLGRTLYWVPPLTIEKETIDELKIITLSALRISNSF